MMQVFCYKDVCARVWHEHRHKTPDLGVKGVSF